MSFEELGGRMGDRLDQQSNCTRRSICLLALLADQDRKDTIILLYLCQRTSKLS